LSKRLRRAAGPNSTDPAKNRGAAEQTRSRVQSEFPGKHIVSPVWLTLSLANLDPNGRSLRRQSTIGRVARAFVRAGVWN
jgi:hypothetical protein